MCYRIAAVNIQKNRNYCNFYRTEELSTFLAFWGHFPTLPKKNLFDLFYEQQKLIDYSH